MFENYSSENIYESPFLFEGKGIPNVLKKLTNIIFGDIKNNINSVDINEIDLKVEKLILNIKHVENKKDIYSVVKFGSMDTNGFL